MIQDLKIQTERIVDFNEFRSAKNPTLINERATIGNMYKWALERGYVNSSQIPLWNEIRKTISYRGAMQRDEYRVLYIYLRNWHKDVRDARDVYEWKLVHDFIFILANTGMRFGEARRIK